MRSSILIPGLLALVAASDTELPSIPPPPAYPPVAPSSLPEASDNMHASSSSKCTFTTTLTLTLTKTIPVIPVTRSHTASETGIPEPSSYSSIPLPPPQSPQSSLLLSYMPPSAKSKESPAPTTPIPSVTTAIPVEETSAASSASAESSRSSASATPSSKSSAVNSGGSNTHVSHIPVQSASSKPLGGSATTVTTSVFSGTWTATRTGTGTGTGSHVPSSTLPFSDAADVVGVPGVFAGVMGWAVLML